MSKDMLQGFECLGSCQRARVGMQVQQQLSQVFNSCRLTTLKLQ